MTRLTKVLLGILILAIGLNLALFVINFKKEIKVDNVILQIAVDAKYKLIENQIKDLKAEDKIIYYQIDKDSSNLSEKIININNQIRGVDYNKIIKGDVVVESLFGIGAGTVIKKTDKEMYILTCYHVVAEIIEANEAGMKINATIGYTLGETGDIENLKSFISYSAEVIKSDEENDLALLKVNYSDPNLNEIKLSENEPQKGDVVYSVGSPLGLLRTVSKGILANKIEGFYLSENVTTFGNSGGGLYNKDGELIGVPSNVMGYKGGLDKDGKDTFIPESSLGLSRDLKTIKNFLEGVI